MKFFTNPENVSAVHSGAFMFQSKVMAKLYIKEFVNGVQSQ